MPSLHDPANPNALSGETASPSAASSTRSLPVFAPKPRAPSAWQNLVNASAKALSKPADSSAPDTPEGLDALMAKAIRSNNTPALDALVQRAGSLARATPNTPFEAPLALAASIEQEDSYALHYLIKIGASPDSLLPNRHMHRLLHQAVSLRSEKMALYLLSQGASIDLPAGSPADPNETPLMMAASLGFANMTRLLLKAGANPNLVGRDGQSALDKTLLYPFTYNPDARLATPYKEPLLHRLSSGKDIAEILLAAGARADLTPTPTQPFFDKPLYLPPLAAAIRLNHSGLIKSLIKAGADYDWLLNEPLAQTSPNQPPSPMAIWLKFLRQSPSSQRGVYEAQDFIQLTLASSLTPAASPALPAPPLMAEPAPPAPSPLSQALPEPIVSPAPAPVAAGQPRLSLPQALVSPSPEAWDQTMAAADRMERHILNLRLQKAILSFAAILTEHPKISSFQFQRVLGVYYEDDDREREFCFVMSNRGSTPERSLSQRCPGGLRGHHAPPIPADPDAGDADDLLALSKIEAWIQALPASARSALSRPPRSLRSPEAGVPPEGLVSALMSQTLQPEAFSLWQAALLSEQIAPGQSGLESLDPQPIRALDQRRARSLVSRKNRSL